MYAFTLLLMVSIVWCESNVCGDSKSSCSDLKRKIQSRIIDGEVAERNSRPFQAALYTRVGTDSELGFCGGALLDPQWVITAAHCCYHHWQEVDNIQVILGAHSLYDRYESGRRIVNVAEIVKHPEWNAETYENDLALLRLANTIQLTDTISTIRLPYLNLTLSNFAGQPAILSGWGIVNEGVSFISPTLRSRRVTVMTESLCRNLYLPAALPEDTVCSLHPTSGTCRGDNGGPMTLFYNPTEEDILIGVASFVGASGCSERPSVFTRVQRYLQWIGDITGIPLD